MTKHGVARCASALLVGCVSVGATAVLGQTNAAKMSLVGTWKLDLERSQFGDEPKPQSTTLTILTDTADAGSWRIEVVTDEGKTDSFHWSGPKDGSMHPVQDAEGHTIGQGSLRNDHDTLIRLLEMPGGKVDARVTMGADGNTISERVVVMGPDGGLNSSVYVFHRSPSAK